MIEKKQNFLGIFGLKCIHYNPYLKIFDIFKTEKKTENDFVCYCSDFRYESNGIFVLGVSFFFFRQISAF